MPALPAVLIAQIVEQLVCEETEDLRSAALVSPDFRHEAQRVLFRSPFTMSLHADNPREERFLDTVIASPDRLALLVRRYRQRTFWHHPADDLDIDMDEVTPTDVAVAQMQNAAIVRKTGAALRVMKRLTHLILIGINAPLLPPGERLADVLRGCAFSLEMFSWLHPCDDHVVIEEFLRTQPNLRHLGLYGLRRNQYARGVDITGLKWAAQEVCPRLESLNMPLETAELFLPGRKIKSLWWTRQYEDIEVDTQTSSMEHLAKELSTVEYMEYDEAAENPPFSVMADYLRNLKLLKIHFHSKQETSLLEKLPKLRVLIVTPGIFKGALNLDILKGVFAHSKTLKYVDVDAGGRGLVRLFEAPTKKGYRSTAPRVSFPYAHSWHDEAFGLEHPEIDGL